MRLIDADECLIFLKENCSENMYLAVRAILDPCNTVQAIPTPKNATNGDIIKAMFPKIEIYTDVINEIVDVEICEDSSELRCSVDWWNAPYKRGDSDDSN